MTTKENIEISVENIIGGELDEPQDAGAAPYRPGTPQAHAPAATTVSVDSAGEPGQDPEDAPADETSGWTKIPGAKRLLAFGLTAAGLCLLIGIGYLGLSDKRLLGPLVKTGTIPPERSMMFDSFVIPVQTQSRFTYVSLSVAFKSRNQVLIREMTENRDRIRGAIYEILSEEINRLDEIPPPDRLREFVIRGANQVLSSGKVKNAFIMSYFAV